MSNHEKVVAILREGLGLDHEGRGRGRYGRGVNRYTTYPAGELYPGSNELCCRQMVDAGLLVQVPREPQHAVLIFRVTEAGRRALAVLGQHPVGVVRWEPGLTVSNRQTVPQMKRRADGDWVTYDDHVAARLQAQRAVIAAYFWRAGAAAVEVERAALVAAAEAMRCAMDGDGGSAISTEAVEQDDFFMDVWTK